MLVNDMQGSSSRLLNMARARLGTLTSTGGSAPAAEGGCTPDYANTGGTGDRTAIITFSAETGTESYDVSLLDGVNNAGTGYLVSEITGKWLKFDFGAAKDVLITEAKWYQGDTGTGGTWKWQGSNNDADWTDIGTSFTLGGVATQTQTSLSGNTTEYRYYRLYGVSGTNSQPYLYELEFKICGY